MMRIRSRPLEVLIAVLVVAVAGCGTQPIAKPDSHLRQETARPLSAQASIPPPVRPAPLPPPPEPRAAEIKYSIVVANQPVRDVLLAIARETKVNVDLHPGVEGSVTVNAIDQTLKQILGRIAKQVDMRYEIEGQTIHVMPDSPYLRNYRVDYVNMSRDTTETVSIATQVISGAVSGGPATGGSGDNNSTLRISSVSRNRFWETLERNIKDMLRETDKLLPEGSSETFVSGRGQTGVATTQAGVQRRTAAATNPASGVAAGAAGTTLVTPGQTQTQQVSEFTESRLTFREAASVIVNPESGMVTVRATSRQHEKVAEFIEQVMGAAKRQVLIAATIVEVELSDQYQAGVDWSSIAINGLGYTITQNLIGGSFATPPGFVSLTYRNPNAAVGGSISSTITMLSQFGKTRVLSSPLLMVLNNQTAVLKVTDNIVYFTIKADTTANANTSTTTFTSTQNVVPVGLIMNLTPQISDNDVVTLNVRPTITSILSFVPDPNPSLRGTIPGTSIVSLIPQTRSREMESILRVASGQTAVLGGLMEDSFVGTRNGLPNVSRIPVFGDLFSYRDDTSIKRELVIFLQPQVVRSASIDGDLDNYRRLLPGNDFFKDTHPPLPEFQKGLSELERGQMPTMTPAPVVPDPPAPGSAR